MWVAGADESQAETRQPELEHLQHAEIIPLAANNLDAHGLD